MPNKQLTQSMVVRKDLISKSEFSRRYKIDRKTLDKLILLKMFNIEIIGPVTYINITDEAVIQNALQYRGRSPQSWHTETPLRMKKKSKSETFDQRFDRQFAEYERTHFKQG